jgi:hypothetical protein
MVAFDGTFPIRRRSMRDKTPVTTAPLVIHEFITPKAFQRGGTACLVKVVGNDLAWAHPCWRRRLRGASVSRGIGRRVETFFIDNSTLLHIHSMDPFAFAISPSVGVETKQSSGTPIRTSGPIPKTEEARFVVFAILCMPRRYDPRLCRYTFKFCSLFEEDWRVPDVPPRYMPTAVETRTGSRSIHKK